MLAGLALREHDLSDLQLKLAEQGLSSVGRLESQGLVSIEKVIMNMGLPPHETSCLCKPTFTDTRLTLAKRSQLLLGRTREGRETRIMVDSWIIMYWNACSLQFNNTSPFPDYK
jgi:pyruvate kinase